VLFSTHVLSDVERVCDRVGILDHGRLVTEGPLDALLDRYALPVYRLDPEPGQAEALERLVRRIRGAPWATEATPDHGYLRVTVTDPARAARELLPLVVDEGVALAAFERVRPTLEDVFLQLVGRDADPPGRPPSAGADPSIQAGRTDRADPAERSEPGASAGPPTSEPGGGR
jgi:ABC-2 type transport system ATP-binding protein